MESDDLEWTRNIVVAKLNGGVEAFRCATNSWRKMYALIDGVKHFRYMTHQQPLNHFLETKLQRRA